MNIHFPPPPAHVIILPPKHPHRGSGRRPGSQTEQGAENELQLMLEKVLTP